MRRAGGRKPFTQARAARHPGKAAHPWRARCARPGLRDADGAARQPRHRESWPERFNVGYSRTKIDKSRRDGRPWPPSSAVPSGRATLRAQQPNVETLGYCRMSLRDKGLARCSPLTSALNHSGIGQLRARCPDTGSAFERLGAPNKLVRLKLANRQLRSEEYAWAGGRLWLRPGKCASKRILTKGIVHLDT
jgi:hypothetical protein